MGGWTAPARPQRLCVRPLALRCNSHDCETGHRLGPKSPTRRRRGRRSSIDQVWRGWRGFRCRTGFAAHLGGALTRARKASAQRRCLEIVANTSYASALAEEQNSDLNCKTERLLSLSARDDAAIRAPRSARANEQRLRAADAPPTRNEAATQNRRPGVTEPAGLGAVAPGGHGPGRRRLIIIYGQNINSVGRAGVRRGVGRLSLS